MVHDLYAPNKKGIISRLNSVIFLVNKVFLQEIMEIKEDPTWLDFDEEAMNAKVIEFSFESIDLFLKSLLPPGAEPPFAPSHFKMEIFLEHAQVEISVEFNILGYN